MGSKPMYVLQADLKLICEKIFKIYKQEESWQSCKKQYIFNKILCNNFNVAIKNRA